MDLRQMRYFLAVVDCGTFHLAAERIGVTQQAISSSIGKLEKEIGVALLSRHSRGAEPTAAGQLLLAHARNIDADIQTLQAEIAYGLGGGKGVVRVGVGLAAASRAMTQAVSEFIAENPDCRVAVRTGTFEILQANLLRGDLDVIAASCPSQAVADRNVMTEHLWDEPYCLATVPDHPIFSHPDATLRDAANYPWIGGLYLGGIEHIVESEPYLAGLLEKALVVRTASGTFARAMTVDAGYIYLGPKELIRAELRSRVLRILPLATHAWKREITLAFRRRDRKSVAVTAFIKKLKQTAHPSADLPL